MAETIPTPFDIIGVEGAKISSGFVHEEVKGIQDKQRAELSD
jgi:hypothetical protein